MAFVFNPERSHWGTYVLNWPPICSICCDHVPEPGSQWIVSVSISWYYYSTFPFVFSSSYVQPVPWRTVFGWPSDHITWSYHLSSIFFSLCGCILLCTWSSVMGSRYEIPRMVPWNLISSACIFLCSSSVSVHVSHACRNIEKTSAYRSLILYCPEMVLPLHMIFSLEVQHPSLQHRPMHIQSHTQLNRERALLIL